jgi:hypothetical protein
MPLSAPTPRKPMHNRVVECRGYEREDGLWDIEGHLIDARTYAHRRHDGGAERQPNEPVHDMWIRFTIGLDFLIHKVEAVIDRSPYAECGAITSNFKSLEGMTIRSGWRHKVMERLGGIKGCTHLVGMLGQIATVAYLATHSARERNRTGKPITGKPHQINACHIYRDDAVVVKKRWPQFYKGGAI